MDMSEHFDVVVLGAGPGGYVAAIRSAQLGLKTAIIEERYWGGVCLNVGCIPSKALLRNAELAHIVTQEQKTFGIDVEGSVSFDYGVAYQRSRQVSEKLVKGVQFLMKKNKITSYDGRGTFTDPNTLQVARQDGSSETVTFDNCIIAAARTPSCCRAPPCRSGSSPTRSRSSAPSCPRASSSRARGPSASSSPTSCTTTG